MSKLTQDATYSKLPLLSGDGYAYGGSAIVTIGGRAMLLGEGPEDHLLAREIVRRWNAGNLPLSQESNNER